MAVVPSNVSADSSSYPMTHENDDLNREDSEDPPLQAGSNNRIDDGNAGTPSRATTANRTNSRE